MASRLSTWLLGSAALSLAGCSRHHTADEGEFEEDASVSPDGALSLPTADGGVFAQGDAASALPPGCVGQTGIAAITCALGGGLGAGTGTNGMSNAAINDLITQVLGQAGGDAGALAGLANVNCRNPTTTLEQLVCGLGVSAGADAGAGGADALAGVVGQLSAAICTPEAAGADVITALFCTFINSGGFSGGGGSTGGGGFGRRDGGTFGGWTGRPDAGFVFPMVDAGPPPALDAGPPAPPPVVEVDAYVPPVVPPPVEEDAAVLPPVVEPPPVVEDAGVPEVDASEPLPAEEDAAVPPPV